MVHHNCKPHLVGSNSAVQNGVDSLDNHQLYHLKQYTEYTCSRIQIITVPCICQAYCFRYQAHHIPNSSCLLITLNLSHHSSHSSMKGQTFTSIGTPLPLCFTLSELLMTAHDHCAYHSRGMSPSCSMHSRCQTGLLSRQRILHSPHLFLESYLWNSSLYQPFRRHLVVLNRC